MSKYDPLKRHLAGSSRPIIEMTFDEIASLVGGLPRSAFEYQAWWENDEGRHVQAHAWLNAGYQTGSVDLLHQRVTFRKN